MLHVTNAARDRIQDLVDGDDLPVRLERAESGAFRLTSDAWSSGDMSYAHDGSALLLVRGGLAERLGDRALDATNGDLQLRPRGPAAAGPQRSAHAAVELAAG